VRCTRPRTVGFLPDGKTLAWSYKKHSKEYPTFQLPCGKCISCRLERARETAVRCVHEAQMHEQNCFITLTYSDENLKSDRLDYRDFQLFIKRLRKEIYETSQQKISVLAVGEYGDKGKRPHWHAIIFNWRPADAQPSYKNDSGDQLYDSELLTQLWGKGRADLGSVTFKSAGYVARYAAKKLTHGKDGSHDYNPIARRSTRNAIGVSWLERYWFTDCFANGFITLEGGVKTSIPRYYEKWLKKHKPLEWQRYVTEVKPKIQKEAANKEAKTSEAEKLANLRRGQFKPPRVSRNEAREVILEQKFNQLLQRNLKL